MRAEDLDKLSVEELQARANRCFEIARSPLEEPLVGLNPAYIQDAGKLRLLLEAQFYLTAVARKRDEEVANRDLKLEIWVIILIGVEILLSIVGIGIGIREANQQSVVLSNIQKSTKDSANAMSAASTSLQSIADEQTASRDALTQMNANLQQSLRLSGAMTSAIQSEAKIVQAQQAKSLAEAAKKPELQFIVDSKQLKPTLVLSPKIRQSLEDRSVFDAIFKNGGNATATKGNLRIVVFGKEAWLQSSLQGTQAYDPPNSETHTYVFSFDNFRPNTQIPMSLTVGYPKGSRTLVFLYLSADADEIPNGASIGNLLIIPLVPQTK
jgi:hypothetical protein